MFVTNENVSIAAPTPPVRVSSSQRQSHIVAESHTGSQSPIPPLPEKKKKKWLQLPPDSFPASSPVLSPTSKESLEGMCLIIDIKDYVGIIM